MVGPASIAPPTANDAQREYGIMVAVLDFFQSVMGRRYSAADVRVGTGTVTITMTRAAAVPAEEQLARTAEGARVLREYTEATFAACQDILRAQMEAVIGRPMAGMSIAADPRGGTVVLTMQL